MPDELNDPDTAPPTRVTAAPLASHLSCWRRSLDARRQLSAWRPTKRSDSPMSTTMADPWTGRTTRPGCPGRTARRWNRRGWGAPQWHQRSPRPLPLPAPRTPRRRPTGCRARSGRQLAVGEEQDHYEQQHEAGAPQLVQHQPQRAQRKVMAEAVSQERVVSAIGAEEQADSGHQEEPPDRVARLAPCHDHPGPCARNAEYQRQKPVEQPDETTASAGWPRAPTPPGLPALPPRLTVRQPAAGPRGPPSRRTLGPCLPARWLRLPHGP